MPGVPVRLRKNMDQHRVQRDVRLRPPGHPSGSVEVEGVDRGVRVVVPPRQVLGERTPESLAEYQASTIDRCLTKPRRLVPVGVSGRRMSYSDSPSSFQRSASRTERR